LIIRRKKERIQETKQTITYSRKLMTYLTSSAPCKGTASLDLAFIIPYKDDIGCVGGRTEPHLLKFARRSSTISRTCACFPRLSCYRCCSSISFSTTSQHVRRRGQAQHVPRILALMLCAMSVCLPAFGGKQSHMPVPFR